METTADRTRIQEAAQEDSQSLQVGIGAAYAPSKKAHVFVERALKGMFTGIVGSFSHRPGGVCACLLYTSDAADDYLEV